MVYKFKPCSHISVDPQIAGEMCEKLEADGKLTAKELVNANRPESAPLHSAFEWDDAIAAESYREEQARHIMSCLITVREDAPSTRAYFNIVRSEPNYRHINTILRDEDLTAKLLDTAMRELSAFRVKYANLTKLSQVFDAIDNLFSMEEVSA